MTKRILTLALAAMMLLTVLTAAAFAEAGSEEQSYYVYTENKKPLNVRDAPNGNIIGSLDYGTKVEVTSLINDNWAVIVFNGGVGYANRRFLIPVEPAKLEEKLAAETTSGDPLTDINAEFAGAAEVEPYQILVRPARVTSLVYMRWIPCETGMIVAEYKATEPLTVLKELTNYLMVQDPGTGDIGYIHKKFAAK